ncbi:MAG: endonuclease MutS2 [Lactimicrobium sp.]|jgi:DNA mismatch repair protein MutS2|uniref:endonuclease MutS2 n=1 Tax=Lactimicrobium sp. TaxID=2563780 RepID=UPI002F3543ED
MSLEKALEFDVIKAQMEQYCAFSLGKQEVANSQPAYDPLLIRRNLARISEALACVVHIGPMPFPGVKDIRSMLESADRGRILGEQDFLAEMRLIEGVRAAVNYEKDLQEVDHPALHELFSSLIVHERLLHQLQTCFNDYGEVKDSASEGLRHVRSEMRRCDGEIAAAANRFLSQHAGSVVDSIVTTRAGRAVVLVKASDKNTFGGMVYGDSASGSASYVEPAALVPLNNRKEHLMAKEQDEIHKILAKCSQAVQAAAREEIANINTLGILDGIFAKARWGKEHDACCAAMTDEKKIIIEKARHPLIDPARVVANDYHLCDPQHTLLITGPNTGGKTVSLKVIGLFVMMSYAGMPVTCAFCTLPYFDRVFADIGDDQSVVSSLSSFGAHVTHQAEICKYATDKSLVLLDEVGSGTDPSEGEALAIAILNELRSRQCMTVATTHYNRLKAYGKRHKDILLASVQFDMEKLEPTYQYVEGLTGQSNAFAIAQRYGLPKSIIKYAAFLKEQSKSDEDKLIERLEAQLQLNLEKQQKLDAEIAENKKLKAQLEAAQKQLDAQKEKIQDKAEEEARAYVEQVSAKADAIMKQMRQVQSTPHYHEAINQRHALNALVDKEQPKSVPSQHHEYQVGDAVQLKGSSTVCEIVRIEKKDITILFNGREMRVKKNQIVPSDHVIAHVKEEPSVQMARSSIFSSMPIQCNLIGMHVDEAMERLDAYLDEAKVNGLKSFRIIHGDGSGALRKAVHARLARDKQVKEFRLGAPSEGGTGATVVTMK